MLLFKQLDSCLLCDSTSLQTVVQLKPIPISTPGLRVPENLRTDPRTYEAVPLNLNLCRNCGQVQLSDIPNVDFEYRNYTYRTSLSINLRKHYQQYAAQIVEQYKLPAGALAVEVGSNDGTLSSFFKERGLRVLGVDPAVHIAQAASAAGIETIPNFFSTSLAREIAAARGPASLICANFCTANFENMVDFAEGVALLLGDEGVLVIETQYGRDVVERNLLDTIYHEHISYFNVKPLVTFFERHGMQVIDVLRVPTKGGSIRLTAQKIGGPRVIASRVNNMLAEEEAIGAATPHFYQHIPIWNEQIRRELQLIVGAERKRGGTVAGWGVTVGTSALLAQYCLEEDIAFLLDDDADKEPFMRGPNYHIPVLPSTAIYDRKPDLVVVFAWRYINPIMIRHAAYLERGGRFVVPLPHVSVVETATAVSPNYISI